MRMFFLPVASIALRNPRSSQEFMLVRSIACCPGNTSSNCGQMCSLEGLATLCGRWRRSDSATGCFTVPRALFNDLRFLGGLRCLVDHGVGVFDTRSVGACLLLQKAHERVVVRVVSPVALPFEQSRNGCRSYCAGLHHAGECSVLCRW